MNNDDKKFDDFIKKSFSGEPSVPAGLEWEKMNIEIPAKKKRRPYLLFLFTPIVLVLFFAAGYLFHDKFDKSVLENESEKFDVIATSKNQEEKLNTLSNKFDATENLKISEKDDLVDKLVNVTIESSYAQKQNELIAGTNIEANSQDLFKNNYTKQLSTSFPKFREVPIFTESKNKQVKRNLNSTILEPVKEKTLVTGPKKIVKIQPVFNLIERSKVEIDDSLLGRTLTTLEEGTVLLFVGAGNNYSSLNFDSGSILHNKLDSYLGLGIQIGLQKNLIKNLHFTLSLDYNEIHTVFTHSREINRVTNLESLTETIYCEHIYKNNFGRYIGMHLGIGKDLQLSERMQLGLNIGVLSGVLMSNTGLTLDDDQITNLSDFKPENSFNLSFSPSLNLQYALTDHLALRGSYTFSKPIFGDIEISKAVYVGEIHQVILGLQYEF